MYQPGLNRQLSQIRYSEVLDEAAHERAARRQRKAGQTPTAWRLVAAAIAIAPVAAWIVLALS